MPSWVVFTVPLGMLLLVGVMVGGVWVLRSFFSSFVVVAGTAGGDDDDLVSLILLL